MGKKVFLVRAISSNGGEIFHLDVEHPICFSPAVILLFRNLQSIYDECEQNKNKENKNKEEEERMPCGMTRRETNGTKREKQAYYTVHSAPKKKASKSCLAKCIPLEISFNSCEIEQFSRALYPIEGKWI